MLTIPGKIPIAIHPLFWLVSFLVGWVWTGTVMSGVVCIALIFLSVLLHEFGHALTALLFQQKARIELAAFGGFTYREGRKLKLWEEFLVVLNGPLFSLLLALAAYLALRFIAPTSTLATFVLKFLLVANIFWTAINLIPVLPLDGGHLSSITLEAIFGFRGVKMAIIVGLIIAIAISIVFFMVGLFFAGALFLILMFENFRSLRYYRIFNEKDREPRLQALLKQADQDVDEGQVQEATTKLEQVRAQAGKGILHTMASVQLAEIHYDAGHPEQAYALLSPIQKHLNGEQLALLQRLAYCNRDYQTVTTYASRCFQDVPSYQTALLNALSFAALTQPEAAIGWFECAIREGLPSPEKAVANHEFDSIRTTPQFQEIALRYTQ